MLRFFVISLILLTFSYSASSQSIDSDESVISFSVSNMKLNTVKGTFTGMSGEVLFNPNDLPTSKFSVCIDANSVDTDNKTRDKHLRNEDFFDVEVYPQICFESSTITKTSSGYSVKGNLTMHGVSKIIEIPFTYESNQLIGDFELNRLDYKVGGTGSFMVGHEISIKIKCVLI